jgi:hypothetical protein
MVHRASSQAHPSSLRPERYHSSETLRSTGAQVEALVSRHSSLQIHKRAIEQQLALMAAQIHEQDVALIPGSVFLLVEIRGSGGVSDQLEHIARILHEQGYWKPRERVQSYHRQDVYHLGRSAQKLFEDYEAADRRVRQLLVLLGHIKERLQVESESTPQAVFAGLAAAADGAKVQAEVDAIVDLLEQANRPGWFTRLLVRNRRK